MKILKILGIIIGIILIVGITGIAVLPSVAHLERQATINASVSDVFAEVNGFGTFNKFSAWAEMDTTFQYTIEGSATGVGAKYSWSSVNPDLGTGSIEIVEVLENALVKSSMKFGGYKGNPTASWILSEDGGNTVVTYTYDEENIAGIDKIMTLFLDSFLGSAYERTLEKLKARIESKPVFNVAIGTEDVEAYFFLGLPTSSATNPTDMGATLRSTYAKIMAVIAANKIEMTGVPLAIYTSFDENNVEMICGVPVADGTAYDADGISVMQTYNGRVVKAVHTGDYVGLRATHEQIDAYIVFYGYEATGSPPWEDYPTDPTVETDTSKWVTNVYYPIR